MELFVAALSHTPHVLSVYVLLSRFQEISSYDEVAQVFAVGRANRAVASTACNEQSSRSHCVLLIDLECTDRETQVRTHGRLVLVDLAGSERVNRSGVQKEQLTEAQNINKSLSALGDVIGALTNKSGHVPFRNSTLTFLLKDSLGKDNKALMLVQVHTALANDALNGCVLKFLSPSAQVVCGSCFRFAGEPLRERCAGDAVLAPFCFASPNC